MARGQALVNFPRIVCVSANPAIDRRLRFDQLHLGRVNRARSGENFPGGKSAHVAMVAQALGARPAWLGFLGGSVGDDFEREFAKERVEIAAIYSRARTRMNLELIDAGERITEMLEPGERPATGELREMRHRLAAGLRGQWRGAVVVISGSLPAGTRPALYSSLIRATRAAGSRVFLDTSGDALRAALAARPDFIKPNRDEAEALLKRNLRGRAAVGDAAHELIAKGAASAAISLGAEGLVWAERKNGATWIALPPKMKAISTVGCGDAAVAGFAIAAARGLAGDDAIRLAAACGAANCLAQAPGKVRARDVKMLAPRVCVERLD